MYDGMRSRMTSPAFSGSCRMHMSSGATGFHVYCPMHPQYGIYAERGEVPCSRLWHNSRCAPRPWFLEFPSTKGGHGSEAQTERVSHLCQNRGRPARGGSGGRRTRGESIIERECVAQFTHSGSVVTAQLAHLQLRKHITKARPIGTRLQLLSSPPDLSILTEVLTPSSSPTSVANDKFNNRSNNVDVSSDNSGALRSLKGVADHRNSTSPSTSSHGH